MTSQYQIIRRWVDRCTGETDRPLYSRDCSNVFADRESLYSYGYHFTIAEYLGWGFLVNADRSTPSTNQQRLKAINVIDGHGDGWTARDAHTKHLRLTIPFKALASAGVYIDTIKPVDSLPDRFVQVERSGRPPSYFVDHDGTPLDYYVEAYNLRYDTDADTWRWTATEHRLGECVFRATVTFSGGTREAWFISAWDNQDTDTYFLSELPHEVFSLAEAYEALKPQTVKMAELEGRHVVRQGDVFAVPTEYTTRDLTRMGAVREGMDYVLNTNHVVTEQAVLPNGAVLGRGVLWHKPPFRDPDHRRQRLGKSWHLLIRNTTPINQRR